MDVSIHTPMPTDSAITRAPPIGSIIQWQPWFNAQTRTPLRIKNFNRAWINTEVNSGKRIIDIGVDLDSPFYQIERHAVSGYPGYTRDFQPNADLRVPSRVMDRDSIPN